MFNTWMECKLKYTKQLDNGALKRVTEPYLFSAMTFTDAEARIYEELGSVIKGEFHVMAITRKEYHDIFGYGDTDIWYQAKIKYDNFDADTEKSKRVTQNFLVEAGSVKEATERLKDNLKTLMVDFEITGVVKSPIVEIFPFNQKDLDSSDSEVEEMEEVE